MPLGFVERLPFKKTVLPSATVWSVPAFATGAAELVVNVHWILFQLNGTVLSTRMANLLLPATVLFGGTGPKVTEF
jgi:hypothetical protein